MLTRPYSRAVTAYLVGLAAPSAATVVMVALSHYVAIPNISLLYVPPILLVAVYFGTGPSLAAATVAAVEYDFFLLRPLFTFSIGQVADILAFVIFLIVAVLVSQLAAGARERAEAAQRRATESVMLYELGQALMSSHDVSEVLDAITRRIVRVFGVDRCAVFVAGEDDRLDLAAETIHGTRDRASRAAATYVFQRGDQVGLPEDDTAGAEQRVYIPLRTADRILGVMEVGRKGSGETLDANERRLLTSFAAQSALTIVRAQSEDERNRLQVLEETDRLKSALLSAVSHDLRTPLSVIKASATALLLADAAWSVEEGQEFLRTIDHEADRLNRLVGNLLDLSRIEAGVLRPVLDWYDVQEVIDAILPRLRPLIADRPFHVDVQPAASLARVDLLRIEELVLNLFENAVKYSAPRSPLEMRVRNEDGLRIEVIDHGAGVPERLRERIFETFYQGKQHSDRNPGTGLGLAICRGIAEAHGGGIHAEETRGGGATFVLTLPPGQVDQGVVV